jgi:hypothetical protein
MKLQAPTAEKTVVFAERSPVLTRHRYTQIPGLFQAVLIQYKFTHKLILRP